MNELNIIQILKNNIFKQLSWFYCYYFNKYNIIQFKIFSSLISRRKQQQPTTTAHVEVVSRDVSKLVLATAISFMLSLKHPWFCCYFCKYWKWWNSLIYVCKQQPPHLNWYNLLFSLWFTHLTFTRNSIYNTKIIIHNHSFNYFFTFTVNH